MLLWKMNASLFLRQGNRYYIFHVEMLSTVSMELVFGPQMNQTHEL